PVIDWVSPVGGFCWNKLGSSTDSACLTDQDCSNVTAGPGTCATSTPNGAVNSMMTIGGRYFASATSTPAIGKVYFKTAAGADVEAKLANNPAGGNAQCTNVWSSDKVVVLVPGNVADTSLIKIRRADGEEDTTNNQERGPIIPNFLKNNIIRPGLCSISPNGGVIGKEIKYFGVNLSGASAFFGSYSVAAIPGDSSVFVGDLSGKTNVPNMQAGKTTTYIQKGLTNSNYYPFEKLKEGVGEPRIISFDPIKGNSGQYVTIHGADFGYATAAQLGITNHVYLDNNLTDNDKGVEASFAFPDVCTESVWSDKQIIFKVASSTKLIDNAKYYVVIATKDWVIDSGNLLTIGGISPTFTFSSSTPLSPSLCLISPKIGMPNITDVSLYGEYFGNKVAGKVKFYKNVDISGFNDSSWLYNSADKFYQVATKTPVTAISGPVVVSQGVNISNSLNFEVGSCLAVGGTQQDKNIACGSICCPENSSMAGQCADTMNTCYVGGALTSVYEWDFDTSKKGAIGEPCDAATSTAVCEPDNTKCASGLVCKADKDCTCQPDVSACSSYDLLQCIDTLFCPNSPGKCSPYQGGENLFDTNVTCSTVNSSDLIYNANLNRYASSTQNCSLGATTKDVLGKDVQTFCALYNQSPRYQFKTSMSCPTGWTLALGGVCVDLVNSCNLCAGNLKCADNSGTGVCVDDRPVCSSGSKCVSEKCVKDDKASCDCCCEIGKEGDCCAGLTCGGTCGSDTTNDGAGFGECSGCNIDGDQSKSDLACNCSGTNGKYCDMTAASNKGVCLDCASLPADSCSDHSSTCCVDGVNGNKCAGGAGNLALDIFKVPAKDAYCAYYDCNSNGTCGVASTTGQYFNDNTCNQECTLTLAGAKCSKVVSNATKCSYDFCKDLYCLDESGDKLAGCDANGNNCTPCTDGTCGNCCCDPAKTGTDPNDATTYDKCKKINSVLDCRANVGPCDGAGRGLCCGCSDDQSCGDEGVSNGCSTDTCCRARPNVASSSPADDATAVCRNAKIEVTFDQVMDINSFSDNTIVAGDYGTGQCPAETQYVAMTGMSDKHNLFARIYYRVIDFIEPILPTSIANALMMPTTNNYCAIPGSVSGYVTAGDKAVLEFSPKKLLDTKRLYYVIIKGDENLNSKTGVKSNWGVGMNGESMDAGIMFNGITYKNSHVLSFETLGSQGANKGVCLVNKVSINPSSYLFQTNINNFGDDVYGSANFDKVKDSDKVFISKALSIDGQLLSGISGVYDWSWGWNSTNQGVASNVSLAELPDYESLVKVKDGVVEGKTDIGAKLTITASSLDGSSLGASLSATSKVYVFICANPWPPVKDDGTWLPWIDSNTNCDINSGACNNANFESYYCRDLGSDSTLDDLPAIGNNDSIVHGTSSQKSMADLVKEVYFFRGREASTNNSATFTAAVNSMAIDGGEVSVNWSDNAFDVLSVKNYKVYWGVKTGSHTFSRVVSPDLNSVNINGLKNNTTYYFNMTAIASDSGAESEFLKNEDIVVLVKDVYSPAKVENFTATYSDSNSMLLNWNKVNGNPAKYIIYYGVNNGYGYSKEVSSLSSSVVIAGLTNGGSYNFGIIAVDLSGNASATTTVQAILNP
ncbi:Ig-like domain-containing protein, partial [Patescibacteria group bacterium]|nr:Ig-like domain-containing protein [Patescibacteria group bacterium]